MTGRTIGEVTREIEVKLRAASGGVVTITISEDEAQFDTPGSEMFRLSREAIRKVLLLLQ